MYEYETTSLLSMNIYTEIEELHIKDQSRAGWELLGPPFVKPEDKDDPELAIYYWKRPLTGSDCCMALAS